MSVSIVTPWKNAPELIAGYDQLTTGAELVIIDNASDPGPAEQLREFVKRRNGILIRNERNNVFSLANNQGLARATGDIIVFLNNDVEGPDTWVAQVEHEVQYRALYGPAMRFNRVPFIIGWCVAAKKETWKMLRGWNTWDYIGFYFEDNDLSLRALQLNYRLIQTDWPVHHLGEYTTGKTPEAREYYRYNSRIFRAKVQEWKESQHAEPAG
jgi:GT2 family glycosyltransferase